MIGDQLHFNCCARAVQLQEKNRLIFEKISGLQKKLQESKLALHQRVQECMSVAEAVCSNEGVVTLKNKYKALCLKYSSNEGEQSLSAQNSELTRSLQFFQKEIIGKKEEIEQLDDQIQFLEDKASKFQTLDRLTKKGAVQLKALQEELKHLKRSSA